MGWKIAICDDDAGQAATAAVGRDGLGARRLRP